MKLWVLSAADIIPDESRYINALFAAGLPVLHLRKPQAEAAALQQIIGEVQPAYRRRLVLHSHYHLAFDGGLGGIHLPEHTRENIDAALWEGLLHKIQQQGLTLSTSWHQKNTLDSVPGCYDYVFFSPVFPSISKPGHQPAEDMHIGHIRQKMQVVGLGGISADNIQQLHGMGYDGAALLGTLWQRPAQAVVQYQTIQKICLQL